MITLKEFLAEPQTMYDGGLVYMQDGGDPLEELIDKTTDLRQRAENIPVPTEEKSFVGDIVEYAGKVGRKVGRKAVDIAIKRVPGVGLISSSPAGEGSTLYTPEETRKLLKTKQGTELNKLKNKVRKLIKHNTKELVNPLSTASDIFNLTRTGKSGKINKNSIKFLRNMSTEELFKGMTETGNEDPGPFFSKMQEVYDANWQEIREYLGESPETIEEYKKEYDVDSPSERNTQRELAEEKGYTKQLTHVTLSPEISNDILRVIPEVNNKNPLLTHDIGIHMTEQTETPNVFDAFKRRSSTPKDPLIREYLEVDSKEPDLDSDEYTDWLDKIESLKSRINHEHKPDYFMTSEELDHYVDQYRSNFKNLDFPEGVNVIPLYAKLDRYISVPDMGVFKKPENWIRKMSYTPDTGEFFNDVLLEEVLSAAEEAGAEYDDPSGYIAMEEYAANQETQYPESVIELYPDYPDYDEKIYMNRKSMPDIRIEGESVIPFETKVKLWRHITSGALRFRDMVRGTERDKAWVEFLRNTLDKMGADAYGYINDIEGGGEVSYMFLHPEKSKSLFSEGFDPTKPEIGKYRGGQIRPMYDGGVVQHMSEGGMPLTIVEVPDKPEGIRHLLNDTKFGRSASDPAYITPNQKTMRTYDKKPVSLSLEQLKDIPGASGEERFRADPEAFGGVGKYGPLRESIKRKGYQDYEGNPLTTDPITLEVNSKGEAVIAEGNHRLAEAIESGRDSVPVHIQYYGGSENIEGPYNPDRLQLGPRVLKEGEKGAIRLSPEKFQSLIEQLPEVEQQLSITEQQLPVTKKSTLPVPKSIKEKLLRNIRNFIPLIKAGRSLSPAGIALNLLQIIPEETMNNAVDYLKNTPTHELFGLEKSGLESVEDLWEEVTDYLDESTKDLKRRIDLADNLEQIEEVPQEKLPVIPKSDYTKEFGNPSSLINKKSIEKLLEKHPNILLDSDGSPVLLFRGTGLRKDITKDVLRGKPKFGFEFIDSKGKPVDTTKDRDIAGVQYYTKPLYLSDNPYTSSTFAGKHSVYGKHEDFEEGVVTPFFIKANKVIEFPVDKSGFKYSEFDKAASKLKPGEVLVAKNVKDKGSSVSDETLSKTDPLSKWNYGQNQYAIRHEGQLINAIAEKKKGGQVRPMYDGGIVPSSTKPMYDGGLV